MYRSDLIRTKYDGGGDLQKEAKVSAAQFGANDSSLTNDDVQNKQKAGQSPLTNPDHQESNELF